jgi:hypothetical protein
MIINNGKILKNGSKIFKSQIVLPYLEVNCVGSPNAYMEISGATADNPLIFHYKTPTGITKNEYVTGGYSLNTPVTGENSYKQFYFSGNLNAPYYFQFQTPYNDGNYNGNLANFIEQFPDLQELSFYSPSIFNQDLSYVTFSNNLQVLRLNDNTIFGNVNTFKNFGNFLINLGLTNCKFTGILTNVELGKLETLSLWYLNYLGGNFNDLINENPDLISISLYQCPLWNGNATTLDVSKLISINLDIKSSFQFTGNCTNWTFNTGLTTFQFINKYIDGDITNWDFSNTLCYGITINNEWTTNPYIHGSLSGWTLPSNLQYINISYISGITSLPINYTGCSMYFSNVQYDYLPNVVQNINDFHFHPHIYQLTIIETQIFGNIESFVTPTGVTSLQLGYNKLTGNFSGFTINNNLISLSLDGNLIDGDISGVVFPNALNTLTLSYNTGITLNLNANVFHRNNLTTLGLDGISGITGDFSNFIIDGSSMGYLTFNNTKITSDLSKFTGITKIQDFQAQSCQISSDITNWLTGTTMLQTLIISTNPFLSGDTTNWNVSGITSFYARYTNLSGKLKHNNVLYMDVSQTPISSNIETDINFSNQASSVQLSNCPNLTGNLSGVTLNFGIQYFNISNDGGIVGSNAFIDYLFINKYNFSQHTTYITIMIQGIGDSVTGTSETLGDLGTWAGNPWDLTEAFANNLADGKDWDGNDSNTPWDSKQKIYWLKNAEKTSTDPSRRYPFYTILY